MDQSKAEHLLTAPIVRLLTPHCSSARLGRDRIFQRLGDELAPATVAMPGLMAALDVLIAAGTVEEVETGYQLTKAGLVATRPPGDKMTGLSVKVRSDQNRLGGAKYPGRVGTVLEQNSCGRGDSGGLWYVRLEPTNRAVERVETFWGKELDLL